MVFCVSYQKTIRTISHYSYKSFNFCRWDLICSINYIPISIFYFLSTSSKRSAMIQSLCKMDHVFMVAGNCISFEISFQVQLMYRITALISIFTEFFLIKINDGQTATITNLTNERKRKSFIHKWTHCLNHFKEQNNDIETFLWSIYNTVKWE